jgi:hypothetical protein
METAVHGKKVHLRDPAMTVNKVKVLCDNLFAGKICEANRPHKARERNIGNLVKSDRVISPTPLIGKNMNLNAFTRGQSFRELEHKVLSTS